MLLATMANYGAPVNAVELLFGAVFGLPFWVGYHWLHGNFTPTPKRG